MQVKEWGNLRFDVLQSVETPTEFLLIEVYRRDFLLSLLWHFYYLPRSGFGIRTAGDAAQHKETKHYLEWRIVYVYHNVFHTHSDSKSMKERKESKKGRRKGTRKVPKRS